VTGRRGALGAITHAVAGAGLLMRVDRHGTVRQWDSRQATFGWTADDIVGRPIREIWPEIDRACQLALRAGTSTVRTAACLVQPDGSCVPADVIAAAFGRRARRGVWILAAPTNASDVVAGLVDRASFATAVDAVLAAGADCGVIVIEASGVEAVNQAVSHAAGDELLRKLAERLAAALPAGAVATRYASRFAVLVTDGPDAGWLAASGAALAGALDAPVAVSTGIVRIDLHVGASQPGPGDDAASLLRHAELALVAARDAGSVAEVYDPAAHHALELRREREVGLRSAVERGEFEVHYQPVVDLREHELVGAEALIRWRRGSGEIVMPTDFIELAESSGAILGIGVWTLQEACRQMRVWNEAYRPGAPLEIAVNLSVRQLASAALTREIATVIEGIGIEPQRVTLEVTESSLMDDPDRMIRRLDELRSMGLTLSMDDFGTGYSSLSYLRDLPVDVVKIDRSFVGGVARTDEEWALVTAIVRLAQSLGKRTLGEGVETPAQLAHLRALGCDLAQGYLFGRPLPAADFERLLAAGTAFDR
jgi:predicted signal transduction protein with EAL and GGDEF domain